MLKFNYRAKDKTGALAKGVIEATNKNQAVDILRNRQLIIISLREVKKKELAQYFSFLQRVSHNDVVNFTRQFSTMINAGLPINEALSLLESQANPGIGKVLAEITQDVQGGSSLSESFSKHPKTFSPTYIALIKSGEAAGVLDKVLNRLADNLEKSKEFRAKVKGAMIYPAIVVIGMIVVMFIMMIVVVPRMLDIFEDFGAELPLQTKALIAISNFFSNFWFLIPLIAFGVFYVFHLIKKTENGRYQIDKLMLKIPIIGTLQTKKILAELTRTLSLLVGTGISIVDGLKIVSAASSNLLFEKALDEVSREVQKGLPLAGALEHYEFFPPLVSQMVSVGEETGKLDAVLEKVSDYFEMESEQAVKALTTAIEPLMMIILGIGVGLLVSAVIMPIYDLTSQF